MWRDSVRGCVPPQSDEPTYLLVPPAQIPDSYRAPCAAAEDRYATHKPGKASKSDRNPTCGAPHLCRGGQAGVPDNRRSKLLVSYKGAICSGEAWGRRWDGSNTVQYQRYNGTRTVSKG